jgi:hypothetical protein
MRISTIIFILLCSSLIWGQDATIRGNVYDAESGDPIMFGNVLVQGTSVGANTDVDGFFSIKVEPGTYNIVFSYLGYDSTAVEVTVEAGDIEYISPKLEPSGVQLSTVDVSAKRDRARTEVQISTQRVSQEDIQSLPSIGGDADIAQYLPVLPGIIFTGDQGGQLYIRGGSPVQNLVLLDGMTLYNPFHSIGLFSVFETELVQDVEVQSAAFSAEYGGRVSAVLDIKTKSGNRKRWGGSAGVSPFQAKVVVDGPLIAQTEERESSLSLVFAAKEALIDETDDILYNYAFDSVGLPFNYRDFYGKLSYIIGNGSKADLFGFNFTDQVNFPGVANLNWDATGGGLNFKVIPSSSSLILSGIIAASSYDISLVETDGNPRNSSINTINANLDFTYYGGQSEFNYGFGMNSIGTEFRFQNFAGFNFEQEDFNTELSGYLKYKQQIGDLILEPSARLMYYSSINEITVEPRFRFKYNINRNLRFKGGVGYYTQNLLSTVNDRDIVNLFVGFLLGPKEGLIDPETNARADSRLQKAWHYVAGVEYDIGRNITFNLEGYLKSFNQMININRNKLSPSDPNYVVETGEAYGMDFNMDFKKGNWDVWLTYSLAYVNRFNGEQTYPTNFDRRHNSNVLITYKFGSENSWEVSGRWNLGTGFPFTLTEGFYGRYNFNDGLNEDLTTGNPNLGIVFDDQINGGRLPTYHRLDLSLKKTWKLSKYGAIELNVSATNAYDRQNIFFFDRVEYDRVDQLPIMPAIGITYRF